MTSTEQEVRIARELRFMRTEISREFRTIREEISSLSTRLVKGQLPKESETPLLLSLSEAAKNLGLSVKTIRRMVDSQKILAKRIGSRVLIPVSQLAEVESANDITTTKPPRRQSKKNKKKASTKT